MRCIYILIVFLSLSVNALSSEDKTLRQVLDNISRTEGIYFVYDSSIDIDMPYRGGSYENKELNDALKTIFKDSGICYKKKGRNIILKKDKRLNAGPNEHNSIKLPEVTVIGKNKSILLHSQIGRRSMNRDDIIGDFSFMSTPDIMKTLQQLPGTSNGVELSSGFFVHGGGNDENFFLVDGSTIYQTSHLGGLFSVVNPTIIRSVDFFKSGFPAQYNGRLSSVTDIKTADGDIQKIKGELSLGIFESKAQIEGPIVANKTSFNVSFRRSLIDLPLAAFCSISNAMNDDGSNKVKYSFYDLNAKITHKFDEKNLIRISLYATHDKFKLDNKSKLGEEINTTVNDYKQNAINATAEAEMNPSDRISVNLAATGVFNNSALLYYDTDSHFNNDDTQFNTFYRSLYKSSIYDITFQGNFAINVSSHLNLLLGCNYSIHSLTPHSSMQSYSLKEGICRDTIKSTKEYKENYEELKSYAEAKIALSDHTSANIGVSTIYATTSKRHYFIVDPRFSIRQNIADNYSFKFSYTRTSQNIHHVSSTYIDMPTDLWISIGNDIRPSRSNQFACGLYFNKDEVFSYSFEGFIKHSRHILQYKDWLGFQTAKEISDNIVDGKGYSYGAELELNYKTPRYRINMFYTLSWSRRYFPELYSHWFYDQFDNRHKFSLSARVNLTKNITLSGIWNIHSGNRCTVPTSNILSPLLPDEDTTINSELLYTKPNNMTLPTYHRLDLGIDFRHITKRNHERIWNISIYNAYCHLNAVYVQWKNRENGESYLKSYGYVPVIPSFSYTIKF